MKEPKSEIYTILSGLGSAYQMKSGVTRDMPCYIYEVTGNSPIYSMDKKVVYQNIEVTIDIYAENSKGSGVLLTTLVDTMLESNYRMTYSSDISNDKYSHIATVFNLVGY